MEDAPNQKGVTTRCSGKESIISAGAPPPPSAIDWRNNDGLNWLTPIRNQAYCGSCVSFGYLGAMEAALNLKAQTPRLGMNLSEGFLFANTGSCDSGTWTIFARSQLERTGVPDEGCMPYTAGRLGVDQDDTQWFWDIFDRAVSTTGSVTASTAADLKALLQQGPAVASMTVYEDFMYYRGGIYSHYSGAELGGHLVVIVGYDDAEGAWIVRNSWGPDWGENGYFRIAYANGCGLGESGRRRRGHARLVVGSARAATGLASALAEMPGRTTAARRGPLRLRRALPA